MAMSKEVLKAALLDAMSTAPDNKEGAMDALAGAIVDFLNANLEVKIPIGGVIGGVTGGSGAPAVGLPNTSKISCEIS